jgi:hypothetical protein
MTLFARGPQTTKDQPPASGWWRNLVSMTYHACTGNKTKWSVAYHKAYPDQSG